jgi:hypothetical protein
MRKKSQTVDTTTINYAERRRKALEYRSLRMSYQAIADRLYNGHRGNCHRDIQRAFTDITHEPSEMVRHQELELLDTLARAVMTRAMKGEDRAINTILRIQERRSRYLGLDTPVQIESVGDGVINVVFDAAMDVAKGMSKVELTVEQPD